MRREAGRRRAAGACCHPLRGVDHRDAIPAHRHCCDQHQFTAHPKRCGRPHRRLPEASSGLSWRSLFALGLSGGLVPSASALILLLGSIATGRVAYGLVLVLGFGAGMAVVLGGVGLLVVRASWLLQRMPATDRLARLSGALQTATAVLVVGLGVVLTGQALGQVF